MDTLDEARERSVQSMRSIARADRVWWTLGVLGAIAVALTLFFRLNDMSANSSARRGGSRRPAASGNQWTEF